MTAFLSRLFRRPRVDAPAWIEVGELQRRLAAGDAVVLVDVRQPGEFTAPPGHLPGAINVPLADLSGRSGELAARRKPVVLICKTDRPSARAATELLAAGLPGCRRPSWGNRRVAPTRAGSRIVWEDSASRKSQTTERWGGPEWRVDRRIKLLSNFPAQVVSHARRSTSALKGFVSSC
jgi:rhodanese-related sulfurtransferase